MKNLAKVLIGIVSIIVIVIAGIWGKNYMDKRALEKDYQQGMELVQSYVTDYLVNNYEGIEKIEWQGVGVEWRNSPIYGPSIMGNYVTSSARVFVTNDKYFTIEYRLNDETEYDYNLKKYVLTDYLNPSNIDSAIDIELRSTSKKSSEEDRLLFENIKKNSKGSHKIQIIYNISVHELTY